MTGLRIAIARLVGALARAAGRGGTSIPGRVLLALDKQAIGRLAVRIQRGSVVISATNGKTTTAAMVAAVLRRAGLDPVHNRAGANMGGGVATALASAVERDGSLNGDIGLFELDEFWVDRLIGELDPRAIALCNLFRDQLDRYGELETIADRWAAVVERRAGKSALVLCADDPLVADLGRGRAGVTYFGVEDDALALPELQHASDSKHCRRCGHPYQYEAAYLGHLGRYVCPNCGQRRPDLDVAAERVELEGTHASQIRLRTPQGTAQLRLPLPGLYNVYNALAATSLCLSLGIELGEIVAGLQEAAAAFGRAEEIDVAGHPLSILLVKNPAGANEVLRTLLLEEGELDLLCALNDRTADGRDVSWVWDADFEIVAPRVRRAVCTGTRAAEMALRLKYAGVSVERLHVDEDLAKAFDSALEGAPGRLYALPTYTALLEVRDMLSDRGLAPRYWA